jgi:hypothetical protein
MSTGTPFVCWVGLLLGIAVGAAAEPAPALDVLDAYLLQTARIDPSYRTDLRLPDDPKGRADGRLTAQSAFLGPFTYRAKTYAELTPDERVRVLQDPQWHAFLLKRAATPPPLPPAGPPVRYAGSIAPEDLLKPGLLRIALPVP